MGTVPDGRNQSLANNKAIAEFTGGRPLFTLAIDWILRDSVSINHSL